MGGEYLTGSFGTLPVLVGFTAAEGGGEGGGVMFGVGEGGGVTCGDEGGDRRVEVAVSSCLFST